MPLAVSGTSLLKVGDSLAAGCCCGENDPLTGDWWCLYGNCIQSELAPDGPWVGRYVSREACERRCLDTFDCGCCSSPNPITGACEECEESCRTLDGENCDGDLCGAFGTGTDDACGCDKYPSCAEGDCGCCMDCTSEEAEAAGRCVPCPDDTICIDRDGSGFNCECVPLEMCEAFPALCPDRKPTGWGYSCSRNLCGDGDCRLVRGGRYATKWQCEKACRDKIEPDCALTPLGETRGSLGTVFWSDFHYSVQSAKSSLCLKFDSRGNPGKGLFRILLKAPMLDRQCRVVASSIVMRDTGWRCTADPCVDCKQCSKTPGLSDECKKLDPSAPYCCNGFCQPTPCKCDKCDKQRSKECGAKDGGFKWTKPRGVTSFTVRVLYDKNCAPPKVCWDISCPDCPDTRALSQECDPDGPGQCCIPPTEPCGEWSCEVLCVRDCEKKKGKFSTPADPCKPEGVCCTYATCKPECAAYGYGSACPAPCCCDPQNSACFLPPPNATCEEVDYPPCCLPQAGGCIPNVLPELCEALGGTSMLEGGISCRPGLCCPVNGANDCAPGSTCCGTFTPPNTYSFSCCEDTKCCVNGQCVDDDNAACPACHQRVGTHCNTVCKPCEQIGKTCCNGKCEEPPCCGPTQNKCGATCCNANQTCVGGQCVGQQCATDADCGYYVEWWTCGEAVSRETSSPCSSWCNPPNHPVECGADCWSCGGFSLQSAYGWCGCCPEPPDCSAAPEGYALPPANPPANLMSGAWPPNRFNPTYKCKLMGRTFYATASNPLPPAGSSLSVPSGCLDGNGELSVNNNVEFLERSAAAAGILCATISATDVRCNGYPGPTKSACQWHGFSHCAAFAVKRFCCDGQCREQPCNVNPLP